MQGLGETGKRDSNAEIFQGLGLYSLITQTQALIMFYEGNSVASCWAMANSETHARTHTLLSIATSAQTQHPFAMSLICSLTGGPSKLNKKQQKKKF